ncbi:hypothetical protein HaLaN_23037, partial [Haematococcus lacustris]
MPEHSTPA